MTHPGEWERAVRAMNETGQGEHGVAHYYESKAREARELAEKLEQAMARKAPPEEIQRLARLLEAAYYAYRVSGAEPMIPALQEAA